ncbi:MAG: hypothetical protein EXX96DRAFT_602526 [Benjaminiella poitrasii]|nr:MAG: hypothetical protein EXX96DRAFT_602526 [Benjaminiella poitrasii]
MTCKTVLASTVASHFRNQIKKDSLEECIIQANINKDIHGIMVYYPVFGNHHDLYLQNKVSPMKDVEGLGQVAVYNLYHNKLFMDHKKTIKTIIPCTPLAVIKILEYLNVYKTSSEYGRQLKDRTVTIINRSEIVSKPLAALLANEGARVFSVDLNGVQNFMKEIDKEPCTHNVIDTRLKCEEVLPISDIIITGVPNSRFKVPTSLLKPGLIAIIFSSFANFEGDLKTKASYFVPSIGKVTIAMLERNLLRLFNDQQQYQ